MSDSNEGRRNWWIQDSWVYSKETFLLYIKIRYIKIKKTPTLRWGHCNLSQVQLTLHLHPPADSDRWILYLQILII